MDDKQKSPALAAHPKPATDQGELATLRRENAQLRAQLSAAGRVRAPAHTFQLSEGDRQELLVSGFVNINGVRRSREEVAEMLEPAQEGVDLGDKDPVDGQGMGPVERSAIRGVDYIWPSVEPGFIDPDVAGTPGVNGPSAAENH